MCVQFCVNNSVYTILWHNSMCTILWKQFCVNNSVYTIPFTQFCVHNSVYTILYTQFCVHNSVYTILCKQFCIHNSVYTNALYGPMFPCYYSMPFRLEKGVWLEFFEDYHEPSSTWSNLKIGKYFFLNPKIYFYLRCPKYFLRFITLTEQKYQVKVMFSNIFRKKMLSTFKENTFLSVNARFA